MSPKEIHTPGGPAPTASSADVGEDRQPPAARVTAGQNLKWLIVCDHASNSIPSWSPSLGVDLDTLKDHIAWDIGAAWVARRLALRFQAPLIESGYSRLLIDCNRYPDAADSIVTVSDRRAIRGNEALTLAQRAGRRAAFFRPYHLAIDAALCEAERVGHTPVFISVHTCASSMDGKFRPWDVGICWSRDERVAAPLLKGLAAIPGITVGDNQPYTLEIGSDFTTPEHAMARGLAHLQVELRQDRVSTVETAEWWADQLYYQLRAAHDPQTWNKPFHVLTSADHVHGIGKWL